MHFCYPNGKGKALIFSYDDGRVADRRLISIFNQYGIRGSFHLNSGKLGQQGYVTRKEVPNLYSGHEISCHGVDHENLTLLSKGQQVAELWLDRRALEQYAGGPVVGLSYAFGAYDRYVADTCNALGIEYARTTKATMEYWPPEDFLQWHPTCHHKAAFQNPAVVDSFLGASMDRRVPLLYIWGHSYELEDRQEWKQMEDLCSVLAGREEIWYTTSLEYCRYYRAARELVFSCDGGYVHNPSGQEIWLRDGSDCFAVPAGYSGELKR